MSATANAGGNVAPNRYVTQDTTADYQVLQSTAGQQIAGVAMGGSRYPSGFGSLDDGFVAILGENLRYYTAPDKGVPLELGGTVVAGDRLKSDANGKGVTTTTDRDEYGSVARAAGASGDIIPVDLVPYSTLG